MEKASSARRLSVVAGHLRGQAVLRPCAAKDVEGSRKSVVSSIPRRRQEKVKWNGWGYEGTQLSVENGVLKFYGGERYSVGDINLSDYFLKWIESSLDLRMEDANEKVAEIPLPKKYPDSIIKHEFLEEIQSMGINYSTEGEDRLVRAHGQTLHEVALLRGVPWCLRSLSGGPREDGSPLSAFPRIPDLVVWPEKHDHVVRVVEAAQRHDVVLIPFGGGTNVTMAVVCSEEEQRMIVSLDTSQMNHILWIDEDSLMACVESGIFGQDLERELNAKGLTTGHEPDSNEFSSLGGWVATRASGMKKNVYGNIEDILVNVKMVTPTGVLQRNCRVPRISCGPDMNHVILGSEGTLGVITEVVLKIRPLPETKECGSIIFKDLETGINFLWEVARQRCQPASLRLIDNEQYKMGQFFKERLGVIGSIAEFAKMQYLTKIKGIDIDSMCVAILVFEGMKEDIEFQERKVYDIAVKKFGGILAGRRNGERGYKLTFAIAYVRDFCLSHGVLGDSFETSVPWDKTLALCRNVKYRVAQECKKWGISHYIVSCRVTQVYDAGSCVYFYLAFNARDVMKTNTGNSPAKDPFEVFHSIEEKARDEILASGGSLSHHHGIGKIRRQWYGGQVSQAGVDVYRAVKKQLDPNNIFAVRNIDSR